MNVTPKCHNLNLSNDDPIHIIGIGIGLFDELFLIRSQRILLKFSFDIPSGTKLFTSFIEATSTNQLYILILLVSISVIKYSSFVLV